MLRKKLIIQVILVVIAGMLFFPKNAKASEGTFELRNMTSGKSRCWASSVMMPEFNFKILLSCRDLVYPPGDNLFVYIMWAVKNDGKVVQVGRVGVGRGEFDMSDPFQTLFITSEASGNPNTPSNRIVMQGSVVSIALLEQPPAPTAKPTTGPQATTISGAPVATTTAGTPATQTKSGGIVTTIVKIFLYIIIGLVVFVILVTVLNARRRQQSMMIPPPPMSPPNPQ